MCGIAGIVRLDGPSIPRETIERMVRTLEHRGPDDEGYLLEGPVGIGMRRLSIIDLEGGRQPLHNEDKSLHVVFNGEIYNFQEVRAKLEKEGHAFYTRSDTEVIVHAYEEYGMDFLSQLNGMFAIALWDAKNERLILARDRLGIKPLYYGVRGSTLVFGSEIKAIHASGCLPLEIDPEAVQAYFALRYIPAPLSIFKAVAKLPAAHTLIFDRTGAREEVYWDVTYDQPGKMPEAYYCERFLELFDDAVRLRLISDVPLGAFLSGGVDSSAIVNAMSSLMAEPPRTFTVGYTERYYDERKYARQVADYHGTEHHEFLAQPDLVKFLEEYVWFFDEPFADAAALPTYLLSKQTRAHVTVALSGDGGDEILAGYDRYRSERLADGYALLPAPLRKHLLNPCLQTACRLIPTAWQLREVLDDAVKKANLSFLPPPQRYLAHFNAFSGVPAKSFWSPGLLQALGNRQPHDRLAPWMAKGEAWGPLNQRLYMDMKTWLAEMMLTKVDRMSMAVSLEVRVPFLDHRLVEFVAAIPPEYKMSWTCLKRFFKRAMRDRLPNSIIYRRKHGFQVPLDRWFRKELQEMVTDVLSEERLKLQGFLQPGYVSSLLQEHLGGHRNHGGKIFPMLVFSLWYDRWM